VIFPNSAGKAVSKDGNILSRKPVELLTKTGRYIRHLKYM